MAKKEVGLFQFIDQIAANKPVYKYPEIIILNSYQIIVTEEDERKIGALVKGTRTEYTEYIKTVLFEKQRIDFKYPTPQPLENTLSIKDFTKDVASFSKGFKTIQVEILQDPKAKILDSTEVRKVAKENFIKSLIEPVEKTEEKVVKNLSNLFGVTTKKEVLNFLNNPGTESDFNMREDIDFMMSYYVSILKGEKNMKKFESTEARDRIKRLLNSLQKNIINGPQFVAEVADLIAAFEGKRGYLAPSNESGSFKGSNTFQEYILSSIFTSYYSQENFSIESIGSAPAKEFQKVLDSTGELNSDSIISIYEKIISKDTDPLNLQKEFIDKINKRVESREFAASGAFRKSYDDKIETKADLKFNFGNMSIYADAKFGKYKYKESKYTPSSGINVRLDNIFSDKNNKRFIKEMNLIIAFILYSLISNRLEEALSNESMIYFMTYLLINTQEYPQNYRTKEVDPTLMATAYGFIWYSDFYKLLFLAIFERFNLDQGFGKKTLVKFPEFKKVEEFKEFHNELDNIKNIEQFLSLIKRENKLNTFRTMLLSSKINFSAQFYNLFENADKADEMFKSVKNK